MGPAHPGHCRRYGPLSPVGRSGGGSTGRPRSCVGVGEGITNYGAATAFLPNFVAFPSLRGLHSSTVQLRRAPARTKCAGVRKRPPGVLPDGRSWWGRGPVPGGGPRGGDAVPPGWSSAAPCQLPPPHPPPPPPPPQDDPPPQDEPPLQEWLPWCPPEDEPPPLSPAHQLPPLPLPLSPVHRVRLPRRDRTVRSARRPTTIPLITRAATTIRMMTVTMTSPSFHSRAYARKVPRSSPPSDASLCRNLS